MGYARPDIAIVGIGLRFPDATDTARFRANLWSGRASIAPMDPARAAVTGVDERAAAVPAGYLDDVSTFDHEFFGLSKREAALTDPQQRLALVLAQRAAEDGGYALSTLRSTDTAVVFGATPAPLYGLAAGAHTLGALGSAGFGAAARIAHVLGLTGPCYAIDSGCNAALLAVHQACRELRDGTADYALAGGVSVRAFGIGADEAAGFDELVSARGECRAFDADADGTLVGEGGAVLLLTTLDRARADGAAVHAVVRGSATRHNGRAAATISTPCARAQATVIAAAWRDAQAPLESAGYLEGHGSGTRLGDAVELEALADVLPAGRTAPLALGSVKTNIGHLDQAAGIAGLVKAVLAVEHGELYPSLNFDKPTGGLDLASAGLEVVTRAAPWPDRGDVRRAGVSSFSLGGMNAHCVVEQPPSQPLSPPSSGPRLIGISARTDAALHQLCADLAASLSADPAPLADVAFTLNRGRDHYARRLAITATDTADLAERLAATAASLPSESGPLTVARPARVPRVVLLLSPDALPRGGFRLPDELPARGVVGELLAGQIAFHDELRRYGVEVAAVLGAGVSRYAARYLAGTGSAVGAEELAAAAEDRSVDSERLLSVARSLLADGPVVFVETAPGGCLGALLTRALGEVADAEIVVPEDVSEGPARALAALYEHGADLDWAAGQPEPARRLRLPGHPLAGVHCWVEVTWRPEPQAPAAPTPAADTADPVAWLRATVRTLLDADRDIDAHENYFELGGNSILALALLDRVTEAYGVRPKLLDVYEHPTIAEFAALLTRDAAPAASLPPVVPQDEYVLSFGQVRMWFHHQLDPDTTLYNLPIVIRLSGPVDPEAVHGTFADLADRHETLRSNFVDEDGTPTLRIRPELGEFFRFADVSAAPDPTAAARDLVADAARVRFDLATDPLMRVLLVRVGPGDHVLQVTMHHAVNDGGSPQIVHRELPELYRARIAGRAPELPPLPVQYRDYARWQRDLLAGNALDGELRYWVETLTGAPRLELPLDKPRPARKSFAGALEIFEIDAAEMAAVRELARRESVSVFVVLLSAFHLLLARYSGQSDIVIGTPTTGRGRPELAGLIGFFNSTVALRTDLSGGPSVRDWLHRVRSVVLAALDHQEIPFDRVVQELGGDRDLSRTPVFDVFHVHQELPGGESGGEAITDFFDQHRTVANLFPGMPVGTAKFDLTLLTLDHPGRPVLDACLEYSTDLFTAETAAEMSAAYLDILRELVRSEPDRIVDEIVRPATPSAAVDYRAIEIPADRPRPAAPAYTRARTRRPLDRTVPDLDTTLTAAWAVLLSWYSGEDRIDLDVAPGPRPLRVDLTDDPTPTALLDRVARGAASVAPDASTPAAAQALPVRYDGAHTSTPNPRVELTLAVDPRGPSAELTLDYATELFDQATADALLADLVRLVDGLLRAPDRPCSEIAPEAVDLDPDGGAVPVDRDRSMA
ncbi:condensation domain-containing protein [Nocardia blacklockiae]|uniref:condensation domain-containing protein n=1 Tax=Nocardia blacklockiae TaxID=480036 RepID=UPI001892EF1D|nr:condensation domain-containing protein [Nocardia blacklockiae]MBF6175772.1 polyketide synthase [Nocardia blacklockiae]